MDLCLHDPDFGYYATRPRLGAEGDFITAPHVSQMVGELLGLWACEVFSALGRPAAVRLVELGPGTGLMMIDVLRAATVVAPAFVAACEIVLLETSAPLRTMQADRLGAAGHAARWIETIGDLPSDKPIIALANEFLDCLPIRQAVRARAGWRERQIALDAGGRLVFALSTHESAPEVHLPRSTPVGAVVEWSPALAALGSAIGALISKASGAAIFLDYGFVGPPRPGDTLQAVRGHSKVDPLAHPGESDLTAHVAFDCFLAAARAAGAVTPSPVSQSTFLRALGIEARSAVLCQATPDAADRVKRQLHRLIGPDQMGELFKAVCIHSPHLMAPAFGGRP
jgi:SAM-dependent MidA family methyltransferase